MLWFHYPWFSKEIGLLLFNCIDSISMRSHNLQIYPILHRIDVDTAYFISSPPPFFSMILWNKLRALCLLGSTLPLEPCPQSLFFLVCFSKIYGRVLHICLGQPQTAIFLPQPPSSWDYKHVRMFHHARLY
jgi:hypothetical protein